MIGTVAEAFAYSKAPRTTFTLLHPRKSARLAKVRWDLKHARAPRLAAIGVLAVALPVGFLLGRIGRSAMNGDA